MAYNIQFDEENNIIRLTITGLINAEIVAEAMTEAIKLAEKNKSERFLVDTRGTVLCEFASDTIAFASTLESLGYKKTYRSAIVYDAPDRDRQLIVDSCKKQGFELHELFYNIDKAVAWLME